MSTKCSMFFDSKTHIYQECFDENHIYIDIDESSTSTSIKLGLKEIFSMIRAFDFQKIKKQSAITDEEIEKYCTESVKARIKNDNPMAKLFDTMVFGDPKWPEEKQIQVGVEFYTKKRNDLKKIIDEVESTPLRWGFYNALNDILS